MPHYAKLYIKAHLSYIDLGKLIFNGEEIGGGFLKFSNGTDKNINFELFKQFLVLKIGPLIFQKWLAIRMVKW